MSFSKLEENTTCTHHAKNLGICIQKPSKPLFTSIVSRLKSFQSWKKTSPTPADLAEAGFYFTGKNILFYKQIYVIVKLIRIETKQQKRLSGILKHNMLSHDYHIIGMFFKGILREDMMA